MLRYQGATGALHRLCTGLNNPGWNRKTPERLRTNSYQLPDYGQLAFLTPASRSKALSSVTSRTEIIILIKVSRASTIGFQSKAIIFTR